jgi:MEMO1 family protein
VLVYGLISPHPPIILPEVGGRELPTVQATIQALKTACAQLAAANPEAIILISPHEDHGFEVPLRFLNEQLPAGIPVERILVTEPAYKYYYQLGQTTGRRLATESKRYAIVASGDLSHVLAPDGPYGFNPAGPVLDETIVAAIRRGDAGALLQIDPTTLDAGAECGLRSILFLLGALDGTPNRPEVLSYEGPFGVGYLVATFAPGSDAAAVTTLARQAIAHYLQTHKPLPLPNQLPPTLLGPAAAFVSLHYPNGDLRGCIGTLMPTKPTLAEEIIANAVAAATHDPRFNPVIASELPSLTLSVDVLGTPDPEPNLAGLDPRRFGIIVSASDGRQGVLLPDLEGVDTVADQIAICRQKGSIGPHEPIQIQKFTVTRHHES